MRSLRSQAEHAQGRALRVLCLCAISSCVRWAAPVRPNALEAYRLSLDAKHTSPADPHPRGSHGTLSCCKFGLTFLYVRCAKERLLPVKTYHAMNTNARRYNLIAVLGISPAILTETIFQLARPSYGPPEMPATVTVITTTIGANFIHAQLAGESCTFNNKPIAGTRNRWDEFCREVLGEESPFPQVIIPEGPNGLLDDVRTPADDQALANACYQHVKRFTREDLPVYGSIAGGRKTMSAHMMNAFSMFARPGDNLYHVLVQPPELERSAFFYPSPTMEKDIPDVHPDRIQIDLVDVRFPRLYRLLDQDFLSRLERQDLNTILEALEEINLDHSLDRVRIDVGSGKRGKSRVTLFEGRDEVRTFELSYGPLSTLLVLVDFIEETRARGGGEGWISNKLFDYHGGNDEVRDRVDLQRKIIWALCGTTTDKDAMAKWNTRDDLSKAISNYEAALKKELPAALAKQLEVNRTATYERVGDQRVEYRKYSWKRTPFPELELHITPERARNAKLEYKSDLSRRAYGDRRGDFYWPFNHFDCYIGEDLVFELPRGRG